MARARETEEVRFRGWQSRINAALRKQAKLKP